MPNLTAVTGNEILARLLAKHPEFVRASYSPNLTETEISDGVRTRRLFVGNPECELYGLLELMDNNPLVCADEVSIPSAAASLALIVLGPLLLSGLLLEPPVLLKSLEVGEAELNAAWNTVGGPYEIEGHTELFEVPGVSFASGMGKVKTLEDPREIAELYQERFDKSSNILRSPPLEWRSDLVLGKPLALYRVAVIPDHPESLASIHVMADGSGHWEAAQLLSAINVMYGFEDALGHFCLA